MALGLALAGAQASTPYRAAPPAIRAALDAALPARNLISPDQQWLALAEPRRFTPLEELARPQLRLAGARFEAGNRSAPPGYALQSLRIRRLMDAKASERRIALPGGGAWHGFAWAPDGKRFVLQRRTAQASELWWGTPQAEALQRIEGLQLNHVLSEFELTWWSGHELIVLATTQTGAPPKPPLSGPQVQEHQGRASPERSLPDLLRSEHDEQLLAHYALSQLARVDLRSGLWRRLGEPGLFHSVAVAGHGQALLTERLTRPFSRALAWDDFPQTVELRSPQGKVLREVAKVPARQGVAIDGVLPGPRVFYASPGADAAIYWVEALDGGNPQTRVAYRDRVMRLAPPYKGEAIEVQRMPHRFARLRFLEQGEHALLTEVDRSRAWTRTYLLPLDGSQSRALFEHALRERFRHPGSPMMRTTPHGGRVVAQAGDGSFWFAGAGVGPKGERPFVDRYSLKDHPVQRVFQAAEGQVETALTWLDGRRLFTQMERPLEAPQLGLREGSQWQALQSPRELSPALRSLKRQYLSFKREDGVELSAWLLLPPDHQEGQRRPALIWAYPREYSDAELASQAAAFSDLGHLPPPGSPVWLALEGYAVVYEATMPVVGDNRAVNDGLIEQLQMNARALVDQLHDSGAVDTQRLAIGGQSYGAFMAVNLLTHTNLFKAGIARSGAYNRTLTPFGFQSERRNLWEARSTYLRISPFLNAEKITEPLLLIHGEQDSNPGTPALQSERLYQALAGLGQAVRLTLLPYEGHTLGSREAASHLQWEMHNWLRRHLGPPR
ncbi:dipeptidyl aminopeptidase/acylaminoacyl peptidase [Inhella inkyongensis]|uniref:Dipeptidyl aminopeptidase/acylaminoacyl peptidase n=1 Tax=Inhella inkyongensis TaxID=392593 RepID=A0A840S5V2_9BURK|nr:prolyl oligopeptidase family serine peptidase [Inhella inkyongensis]MBB5205785.1 dipeptidyl aminopeptidase/acylaminoacyl peptidase [Inhella inkyongensis]